jgi:amidophosphoribosyltransferase
MQTRGEFIAKDSTPGQIAAKLGADAVIYQDILQMEKAVRTQNKSIKTFCKACFTGKYPTEDVTSKTLKMIEEERDHHKVQSRKIN